MTTKCADAALLQTPTTEQAQSQRGSVLIEFAFILPLLLLLLFGVISFTVALYNKTVLTMAAREGARAGAVYDPDSTNTSITRAQTAASRVCQNNFISFGNSITPTITPTISGDTLTVEASGNYTGVFVFSNLFISAETSMRLE